MRRASFCLAVSSLMCVSFLFHKILLKGLGKTICGPLYPRVLGGSTGDTWINTMDHSEYLTVVGGDTRDTALTGGISTSVYVGFIASYLYD